MSDFRPAQLDIQIWKGDSWQQTFTLTLDSTPINLSTADVKIQIVSGCSDTVLATLTEGDGITVGGASNNSIIINKVISLDAGEYKYDLQVTFSSGIVKTYLWGEFSVTDDITT